MNLQLKNTEDEKSDWKRKTSELLLSLAKENSENLPSSLKGPPRAVHK